MNLVFENGSYAITANGQTRTYSDIATATVIFEMMTQERIGYDNAHKPDFEPENDHQRNGVDAWFQEQEGILRRASLVCGTRGAVFDS